MKPKKTVRIVLVLIAMLLAVSALVWVYFGYALTLFVKCGVC